MQTKVAARIFLVNKARGPSSYDLLRSLKKRRNELGNFKKIGHFGTLDPFASGLLLVGTESATKLMPYVQSEKKTYFAVGRLGYFTDSGDKTGSPLSIEELKRPIDSLGTQSKLEEQFRRSLDKFLPGYYQLPPMFSAGHYKGKRLYELAREGQSVERIPVYRHIYSLQLLRFSPPWVFFRAEVGKGTYLRTLFSDWASASGGAGHLVYLKREKIGQVLCPIGSEIEEATHLDVLPFKTLILPPEETTRLLHSGRSSLLGGNSLSYFWIELRAEKKWLLVQEKNGIFEKKLTLT